MVAAEAVICQKGLPGFKPEQWMVRPESIRTPVVK